MHVVASMNNNQLTNSQVVHICANAGANLLAGSALPTIVTAGSNRTTGNSIDSVIGQTTFDVAIREVAGNGAIEYVVWKRERQDAVPAAGTGLPTDAEVITEGLQGAYRRVLPGRIFKFGVFALATGQPRAFKVTMNWSKFKVAKIKTGDFYGITVFWRSGSGIRTDFQTRYNEYI